MDVARSSNRTGILIVRLWVENNAPEGFRARITQTLDSTGDERSMATAPTPEDLYAAVRTWVETFVELDRAPANRAGMPATRP